MRYLSVCSGIEAATVAWRPLGWHAVGFSEIEAFPSAVLAHHYPDVPNRGDLTRFKEWPDAVVDVLVGGTPCQSFSVAGLRAGLADPRGSLLLTYLAMAGRYRPRWLVWENVPGVLSADDGRAFGSLLGGLAELGYGFAYRVLDAQYFGLAQRRARVFVVGCLGDWRRAAAVLFERESLSGHPAPRRETWEGTAPTLAARTRGGGGLGTDFDCDGGLVAGTVPILDGHKGRTDKRGSRDGCAIGEPGDPMFTLRADSAHAVAHPFTLAIRGRGDSHDLEYRQDGTANAVLTPNGGRGGIGVGAVAFAENQRGELTINDTAGSLKVGGGKPGQGYPAVAFQPGNLRRSAGAGPSGDTFPTLNARGTAGLSDQQPHVAHGMQVRRLTPRECERLQGFPDDYTLIPYRGKLAADGPRYKALGNSMAVPCMRWIGQRIAFVDAIGEAQDVAS